MYYCPTCRNVFLLPGLRYSSETHWWLDGKPAEEIRTPVCPECGDEDFEKCPRCESCAEEYHPDELLDGLCPRCRAEAKQSMEP